MNKLTKVQEKRLGKHKYIMLDGGQFSSVYYRDDVVADEIALERKRIVEELEKMKIDIENDRNDDMEPKVALVDVFYFIDQAI